MKYSNREEDESNNVSIVPSTVPNSLVDFMNDVTKDLALNSAVIRIVLPKLSANKIQFTLDDLPALKYYSEQSSSGAVKKLNNWFNKTYNYSVDFKRFDKAVSEQLLFLTVSKSVNNYNECMAVPELMGKICEGLTFDDIDYTH